MKFIPNAVSSTVVRQVLLTKKNSPTIMFVSGVIGVTAAAVLACRATLKLEETLSEVENDLADLEVGANDSTKTKVYIKGGLKIAKLYGPSFTVGVISIAALTGSHNVLSRRNTALVAAYTAAEKAFSEYRDRVLADVGEEKEREYRYGLEKCEIEDPITGKKKVKLTKTGGSQYAKFFDSNNRNWSPAPEYNMMFLRAQQSYANDLLQSRGHVLLNDIYDNIGFERTPAGAVCGWVKGHGDNEVDFGIFDKVTNEVFDFVAGREGIWLDFNVDGVVYEMI